MAECKNYQSGHGKCCGNWDENGICRFTLPPRGEFGPKVEYRLLNPCQKHDEETQKIESATKFDGEKPKLSYIPQLALLEVGKSFTYGAKKYNQWNYSKGMQYTRYTDAALRHINQALRGADIDEESGENRLMHLANAIASLMMCLDNQLTNKVIDDRNTNYEGGTKL